MISISAHCSTWSGRTFKLNVSIKLGLSLRKEPTAQLGKGVRVQTTHLPATTFMILKTSLHHLRAEIMLLDMYLFVYV